jgi:glutathione synthase/RimK-type ligase-like ATP-grasp enzyme
LWEAMLALLDQHPKGVVVKPNEGTSGKSVFRVKTKSALELAVNRVFAVSASLAISPLLDIEDEVRVVLIDDVAAVVYRKDRPFVLGDGKQSMFELALSFLHLKRRSTILPAMIEDLSKAELDAIVPRGERRVLNWHHNLESGATPVLLERGDMYNACVQLAIQAAHAIGIRFASIDVVRAGRDWKILEVNSGVMMESLNKHHPDLVYATYSAALDKVFG